MNPLFLDDPVNAAPTDPPPTTTTRTAFNWPFTSASAWNIPIASSATFADDPKIRLGGTASSNIGQMWTLNALQPPVSGARRRLLSPMTFPPFP